MTQRVQTAVDTDRTALQTVAGKPRTRLTRKNHSEKSFASTLEEATGPPIGSVSIGQYDQALRKAMKDTTGDSAAGFVSEESLFAATAGASIRVRKGGSVYRQYVEAFNASSESSFENRSKAALIKLQSDGLLSRQQANQLYSKAFAAAQLDGNSEALYDSIGGARDKTIATASTQEAIIKTTTTLSAIDDKSSTPKLRDIFDSPVGQQRKLVKIIPDADTR